MNILILHAHDNVAIALTTLQPGETAASSDGETIRVVTEIPASHKIARVDIPAGTDIVKYGEVIAVSTTAIDRGDWVHTHNLEGKQWKR